jgi:hypothetical protein
MLVVYVNWTMDKLILGYKTRYIPILEAVVG